MNDDDAPATKRDLRELEARLDAKLDAKLEEKLEAKLEEKLEKYATKADLERVQRELSHEIARAAGATQDEMRRWFSVLLEKHDSVVTATNGNVAQLRTDFEAHRDDTKVHVTRVPRRRSR